MAEAPPCSRHLLDLCFRRHLSRLGMIMKSVNINRWVVQQHRIDQICSDTILELRLDEPNSIPKASSWAGIWCIWFDRNDSIFNNVVCSTSDVSFRVCALGQCRDQSYPI
ncbi:hypothetical protein PIB30_020433 [Stylosanthes scabra]|uniref:Uncharacterized protein n=1 Tax=Stylosanthes scabra TaxID=79078 RepID=A0ABU6T8D0_9FABA|nr:hypothetical protein [Stylosanthes scabra]